MRLSKLGWSGKPVITYPPLLSLVSSSSNVYADREDTISNGLKMAEDIASKSPVAVHGSKVNLTYSRDHTVQEGLDFAVSAVQSPFQTTYDHWMCRWYGTRPCYSQKT